MAFRTRFTLELVEFRVSHVEIDLGRAIRSNPVKLTDISNAVERNTHSNLKLGGREIDPRDHLSCWMLDLKTRVQLQEIERVIIMTIEIYSNRYVSGAFLSSRNAHTFNGAGADVSDKL